WLAQDHRAIFCVGVVAEVRAFIDEALAGGVEHNAERIGVLLEPVADGEIAELGGVAVPADGMTARPVSARRRAGLESHTDAVAGVEARAAHFREVPARAQIARAPFGISLEAARREDHCPAADRARLSSIAHRDAMHAVVVVQQGHRSCFVGDPDAVLRGRIPLRFDDAGTAAPGLHREPTPEFESTIDFERLPSVYRREAHALAA